MTLSVPPLLPNATAAEEGLCQGAATPPGGGTAAGAAEGEGGALPGGAQVGV